MRIFKNATLSFVICLALSSTCFAQDESDLCPEDPIKQSPGVCGCGVADADVNANGIVDCLSTPDTAATIAALIGKIARVKALTGNPALDKAIKRRRADLKNAIRRVVKRIKVNQASITVRQGKDISKLISTSQVKVDGVLNADDAHLKAAKKAALRSVVNVLNALFVPVP